MSSRCKLSFESYLERRVRPSTATRYKREIELFCSSVENPDRASYDDVMEYLGAIRSKSKSRGVRALYALKAYFNYLLESKQRHDHPCKYILFRDSRMGREIQLQDLFKTEELELLLKRRERYRLLKNRNLVITSLLIYQGLTRGEIQRLKMSDVDLDNGEIRVTETHQSKGRTLKLKPVQLMIFYKYMEKDRPKLLKIVSDQLIISKLGRGEKGEGISYVIETQKHLFPDRVLNCKTIRQSVITNLLNSGNDLRVVQVFAGHRSPSTTEQYKQTQVEELKRQVLKCHPLQEKV